MNNWRISITVVSFTHLGNCLDIGRMGGKLGRRWLERMQDVWNFLIMKFVLEIRLRWSRSYRNGPVPRLDPTIWLRNIDSNARRSTKQRHSQRSMQLRKKSQSLHRRQPSDHRICSLISIFVVFFPLNACLYSNINISYVNWLMVECGSYTKCCPNWCCLSYVAVHWCLSTTFTFGPKAPHPALVIVSTTILIKLTLEFDFIYFRISNFRSSFTQFDKF